MRIDLQKVAALIPAKSVREYLSKLEGADLDFEAADFEFFESVCRVESQAMFALERGPFYTGKSQCQR